MSPILRRLRPDFLTRISNIIIIQVVFVFAAVGLIFFYPQPAPQREKSMALAAPAGRGLRIRPGLVPPITSLPGRRRITRCPFSSGSDTGSLRGHPPGKGLVHRRTAGIGRGCRNRSDGCGQGLRHDRAVCGDRSRSDPRRPDRKAPSAECQDGMSFRLAKRCSERRILVRHLWRHLGADLPDFLRNKARSLATIGASALSAEKLGHFLGDPR